MSDSKLLQARAEILAILHRYDIAGHVILHNAPASEDADGKVEVFHHIHPSYSKLLGDPPEVRLRSKLADYHGDAKAQQRDLRATANMASALALTLGQNALVFLQLASVIDKATGAEHTPLKRDDDPANGPTPTPR